MQAPDQCASSNSIPISVPASPRQHRWAAVSSAIAAVLTFDRRWLDIHSAVMQRLLDRYSLPRVEDRLAITLWQLAYRFGRVTPGGIRLHLPVTHSQLAEIVCAQRPSVTSAIARLRDQGQVVLTSRHEWLLCGDPPVQLAAGDGAATGR